MNIEKLSILKQLSEQITEELRAVRTSSANLPDLPSESQMRWVVETRSHMDCADHFLEAMNDILKTVTL